MAVQLKNFQSLLCGVLMVVALVVGFVLGKSNIFKAEEKAAVGEEQAHVAKLGELVSTDTIIMGFIPEEDPTAVIERRKPLIEHLTRELGRPVISFFATDYTGIVEAMRVGKIHIAWMGPFSYVMAAQRANAAPLAVAIHEGGRTTYRSFFVTTPEIRDILGITTPLEGEEGAKELFRKLEPHKKRFSFAFTDPGSTSGFAVPRYIIHKGTNGQTPEEWFRRVGFVGTHDAALLVVKNDIIDISAMNEERFHEMMADGRISPETNVVIYKSMPIPESPLAYRKDLPRDIVEQLKNVIVNIPKEVAATQGTYQGYQIVTEKDFRVIVEIKELLDSL